jgi:hypothetical protein
MYTTTQSKPSAAKTSCAAENEPTKFVKRIGSTTYVVSVRFSEKATETLEQKLLRLIEREVTKSA